MAGTVIAGVVEVGVRANTSQFTTGMAGVRRQSETFASKAQRAFSSTGLAVANLTTRTRQLAGMFAGPAGLVGLAGAAAIGLGKMTAAALDSTRRQQELANALTATGNRSRVTAGELEVVANEISSLTGRSVDDVRALAQELVKAGVVGTQAFRDILTTSARLSSAGFGTLEQNALRLAQAIEEPRQALLAFHQQGIAFTTEQARTVRALAETNRHLEAMKLIHDVVREKMSGVRIQSAGVGTALLRAVEEIGKAVVDAVVDLDWLQRKLDGVANAVAGFRDRISGRSDRSFARSLGLDGVKAAITDINIALNQLRQGSKLDPIWSAHMKGFVPSFDMAERRLDALWGNARHIRQLEAGLQRYLEVEKELQEVEQHREQKQKTGDGRASEEQIKRSLGLSPDHLAQFQRRLEFERQTLGMTEAQTRAEESLLQLREQGVHLDVRAQANIRNQVIEIGRLKELMQTIKEASTSVFDSMANAIVDFATTGKVKFRELADSIVADLLRIALRAFVTNQIVAGISGIAGGLLGGSTVIGPSGIGAGGTTTVSRPGMLGFAEGGAFKVPGSGAGDRPTLVGLAPGELVTITPQHKASGAGASVINNVIINSSREFQTQQQEREGPDGQRVIETILSEVKKDMGRGGFDNVMGGRYGSSPRVARR